MGSYAMNKKSIGSVILLTIVTCGIYQYIWMYDTTRVISDYNDDHSVSPGMVVLLSIVTCGIYYIYWWYRIGSMFIDSQYRARVANIIDNKVLFVILSIFGLGLVSMAIFQSDLNRFWDEADSNNGQPMSSIGGDDEWMDY